MGIVWWTWTYEWPKKSWSSIHFRLFRDTLAPMRLFWRSNIFFFGQVKIHRTWNEKKLNNPHREHFWWSVVDVDFDDFRSTGRGPSADVRRLWTDRRPFSGFRRRRPKNVNNSINTSNYDINQVNCCRSKVELPVCDLWRWLVKNYGFREHGSDGRICRHWRSLLTWVTSFHWGFIPEEFTSGTQVLNDRRLTNDERPSIDTDWRSPILAHAQGRLNM